MPSYFQDNEDYQPIEKLYAPPGKSDPGIDSDTSGSSNHANVFNSRLQGIINRTAWLRKFLTTGRIKEFLDIEGLPNKGKLLGYDSLGAFGAYNFPMDVGMVRMSVIQATSNPFQDSNGFWWFIPDGSALSPAQPKHELLYKAVWGTVADANITGGRGTSSDSDWNSGKNIIYPDCRDDYLHMRSPTRPINRVFGSREVTLIGENFRHRHNLSLQGFTAGSISTQQGTGATVYNAIPLATQAAGTSRQNVAGNRKDADDGLGAIWENTPNPSEPVRINPPGISIELMIYLGFRY